MEIIFGHLRRCILNTVSRMFHLLALGGVAVAVLFFRAGGCDCSAGGDSHPAAISGAGNWIDRAAHTAAGFAATLPHVAVSAARACWLRLGFIFVLVSADQFAAADPVCCW